MDGRPNAARLRPPDRPTDPTTRALVVNIEEAQNVRHIFARYLELGSVHLLCSDLERDGRRSKTRITTSGKALGGLPFSRGALYHLLKNRLYLGEIVHKDQAHPGRHPAIVERKVFDAVQTRLVAAGHPRRRTCETMAAPLKGRIFDVDGRSMSPVFARGRDPKTRYRYYVSALLQQGGRLPNEGQLRRIPAQMIEDLVIDRLSRLAGRPGASWPALLPALKRVGVRADGVSLLVDVAALASGDADPEQARATLRRRCIAGDDLTLQSDVSGQVQLVIPVCLGRRCRSRISTPDGAALTDRSRRDPALIKGLRSARALLEQLNAAPTSSVGRLLTAAAPATSYERRLAMIAFLAPDIQDAILQGRQPLALNMEALTKDELPLAWADQRKRLGFAEPA